MSDFVTELRREVVGAHAAHRVSAVRTRRRRRRPILAGAVALAALLVAVVWTLRSLPPPQQTTKPRIVKVVHIGGDPMDGTFAAGSLWVADFGGDQVVRIDPVRRTVIARIPIGNAPENIAADSESVWANTTTDEGRRSSGASTARRTIWPTASTTTTPSASPRLPGGCG